MEKITDIQLIQTDQFSLEVYKDLFNKRIRVDDLCGNIPEAIKKAETLVNSQHAEKLIIKGRKEHYLSLIEHGYHCEAMIENYFLGSNLYFFCKYYTSERRTSTQWLNEDHIVKNVVALERNSYPILPPSEYKLKKITIEDAKSLANLYGKVFQIYPTPLNDPQYIEKTIQDGTIYYCFHLNGEIVSAASAEVNSFYKNAELTDCATLPEHRKHGLMKILLEKLEADLRGNGVYCAYSIARSLSFGMNAALHQLGYYYRGRLINNCYIFDKLEDMNVWVKDLSK
ncbi:putative beta-lysine N-acetyltransferase [Cytobacillus dafuensis]|uniref:Putative beta-lysine N-acetyltransferase n=1 Tax=Cytobacillus dafuensis TaxID=1742359 RepID=A0A5B8Z5E0_CYTDA|nr:putative beta-lysine N-acetyltransferase [Cytobacillus dafuensis]QED48305.1 putative beta-lysine N-acetyltransferase [Cytobacillus dafuensis]